MPGSFWQRVELSVCSMGSDSACSLEAHALIASDSRSGPVGVSSVHLGRPGCVLLVLVFVGGPLTAFHVILRRRWAGMFQPSPDWTRVAALCFGRSLTFHESGALTSVYFR